MVTTSPERAASCTKPASVSRDCSPVDFDADAHPIIAKHWFGVEPFRPIGAVAAETVADLRFRREVKRLHRLGDRALGEFLAELGAERSITTIIHRKLDCYADLDPAAIEAAGGDKFWPVPIREVQP